jgi:hypothetical protein
VQPVTSNGMFTRKISAFMITKATKNFGLFYLCVTATLASGQGGVRTPCTTWGWIEIEVPIALVSNGCGGMTPSNWINRKEIEMLDTRDLGSGIVVNFRNPCNFRDAAYKGLTVKNPLTNLVESTRHWTRKMVDDRFKQELVLTCSKLAEIGIKNRTMLLALPKALSACNVWTERYYAAVRTVGEFFFDADPTLPGDQIIYAGHLADSGYPFGVERDNS